MSQSLPPPLRLGVNVDHVATLRQARGTDYPDPVEAGLVAIAAGADGITVHLREDRRHIQEQDVRRLMTAATVPVNLEMAAVDDMLALAEDVAPPRACLVPEKRQEVTTEGGLDVAGQHAVVIEACRRLAAVGTRVSLFVDADVAQLDAILATGAPAVEIHTGAYAEASGEQRSAEISRLRSFARAASERGLEVHAGHGLRVANVGSVAAIPQIVELNIGHAIIADAVFHGLPAAIARMRRAMLAGRQMGD
ncbi:pyridoxine 5'-phosphate synthase [Algiphilus sp.]|uniref:pyridoxine 5'-phosphate synthase n=1 Tax=Algiphilus sp. TaxID=1872431 RepID=UPI003B52AC7B